VVSFSSLSVFAIFAVLLDFLLFCWREVASGDLFEELVRNLLCAVADGLEG
jgi:type IV secretory pathway TrbL component